MSNESTISKATQYLIDFEVWLEQNESSDIEAFLNQHNVAPGLADEIREVLQLEVELFYSNNEGAAQELVGLEIENYRVLRKLGSGGMATVWLAEQIHPVQRLVALKVLSSGLGSRSNELVRRLEKESQVLARLAHPNIARVFDAGKIEKDVPYFVMEYIDGISITDYCNAHYCGEQKDALGNRLRLFQQLCDGIQHVHQNSLLHRDIKPSNVMVTVVDGKPHVKVIDLGLAKVLRVAESDCFEETNGIGVVGSPLWMSPEQVLADDDSEALQIDTRSDIYSMGALLYELLTGTSPLEEFRNTSSKYELLRAVVDAEYDRPSTRLANIHAKRIEFQSGGQTPFPWTNRLKNDLDWVVMKALAKDRDLRYSSVGELRQDVERFLKSEPVVARPPSLLYNISKLISKNLAVAAILAVMLIGLAGTSIVSLYALAKEKKAISEAVAARDDAVAARDDALAAKTSLEEEREFNRQLMEANSHSFGLINVNNPGVENDSFKMQLLTDKKAQIDKMDWSSSPEKELAFRKDLADSLAGAGFESLAIEEFKKVSELSEHFYGVENQKSVKAKVDYAGALISARKLNDAESIVEQCVRAIDNVPLIDDECRFRVRMAQQSLEAFPNIESLKNLLADVETRFGRGSKIYVSALSLFAESSFRQGWIAESLQAWEKAIEAAESVYGNHQVTMNLKLAYWADAAVNVDVAKVTTAEIESFVSNVQRKFGDHHPFSLKAEKIETEIKFRRNELDDLVGTYEGLISKFENRLGEDHPECVVLRYHAASNLRRQRLFGKAIEHFEICLPKFKSLYGPDSAQYLQLQQIFAKCLIYDSKFYRAYKIATECLPTAKETLGKSNRVTLDLTECIGICAFCQGKTQQAKEMFMACIRDAQDEYRKSSYLTSLSQLHLKIGNFELGIKSLEESIGIRKKVLGVSSSDTLKSQSHLLTILLRAGRFDRAEEVADELLEIVRPGMLYMDGVFYHAWATKAECLVQRNACDEAVEAIKKMKDRNDYRDAVERLKNKFDPANPCYSIIEVRALAVLGVCDCKAGKIEEGNQKIDAAIGQFRELEKRIGNFHGLYWFINRLVSER